MPSLRVLVFLLELLKIRGAMSLGLIPCSHALSQKDSLLPSPTQVVVAAANSYMSVVMHGASMVFQVSSKAMHLRQSHLSRMAHTNLSRWRMPSPPKVLGLAERVQFTLHLPPVSLLMPAQRNRFLNETIQSSMSFGDRMAERT